MKKIKLLDIILAVFFFSLGIFLTLKNILKPVSLVYVKSCGDEYEYSASKDGIYKISGAIGVTTFEIKNGKIRIVDSPCPNKICVHQGWDSPLVCLPNDVIIYLENDNKGNFDAATN